MSKVCKKQENYPPIVSSKRIARLFSKDLFENVDWLEWSEKRNNMYCFSCYTMSSGLYSWIGKGNKKYTNKNNQLAWSSTPVSPLSPIRARISPPSPSKQRVRTYAHETWDWMVLWISVGCLVLKGNGGRNGLRS